MPKQLKGVGPYTMVWADEMKTFEPVGRTFRFLISGAYNAGGLIGSEYNGVVILDEDHKEIVADRLVQANSGYYGPTKKQADMLDGLLGMSWGSFLTFLEDHPEHVRKVPTAQEEK